MTRVELVIALQDVEMKLRSNAAWKRLGKEQRERLLEEMMRDLTAALVEIWDRLELKLAA